MRPFILGRTQRRQLLADKKVTKGKYRSRKPNFFRNDDMGGIWAVPFPGSDRSVVQRSQYFNYGKFQLSGEGKPVACRPGALSAFSHQNNGTLTISDNIHAYIYSKKKTVFVLFQSIPTSVV